MEDGLVDGEVLLLHVLEDGGGPANVPLLTVEADTVLVGHTVGGQVILFKLRQELRYVDFVIIFKINLIVSNVNVNLSY